MGDRIDDILKDSKAFLERTEGKYSGGATPGAGAPPKPARPSPSPAPPTSTSDDAMHQAAKLAKRNRAFAAFAKRINGE